MVALSFRTYYSIQHLHSASFLSNESYSVEKSYDPSKNQEKMLMNSKNNAYVTGSLFASISFIEANINEIICDIVENDDRIKFIPIEARNEIKNEWLKNGHESLEKRSILNKYNIVLKFLKTDQFDKNSELYQNINSLIELRNTLIHFKPEWNSIHSPYMSESENQHKLTSVLKGKFEYSAFFKNSGNPFYPDKCISYGCSNWALNNALLFADEFHQRIKLKPIYEHIRSDVSHNQI